MWKYRGYSSFGATTLSLSFVLFFLGITVLLIFKAGELAKFVKENISISVMLNHEISEAETFRIKKQIGLLDYVKETRFISRQEAAEQLQQEIGHIFEFLGENPLLSNIEIFLHAPYANPDSIGKIEDELQKYDGVQGIYYDRSSIDWVHQKIGEINLILLGIGSLMLLISIVLINNTLRLRIYNHRFLLNTMKLVGASKSFIAEPFIEKAFVQGMFSALLSTMMILLAIYFSDKELYGLLSLNDWRLFAALLIGQFLMGTMIAIVVTYFAVKRFLRLRGDELHVY